MTQTLAALMNLGRRMPAPADPPGSLYLGLQVPKIRILAGLMPEHARPRHTMRPHLLAVGAGGRDLDFGATLLRPQVLYSLAHGEQVIGIGHSASEVDARVKLAHSSGRLTAIACFPHHTPQAASLLAAYPDLHLLLLGDAEADNLPEDRILRRWEEADMVEVLAPNRGNVPQAQAAAAFVLNHWQVEWEAAQRRGAQWPALIQIDLPGSGLPPTIPPAGGLPGVQVVLHAMTWAQLEERFGAPSVLELTRQVATVLTTDDAPLGPGAHSIQGSPEPAGVVPVPTWHRGEHPDPYSAVVVSSQGNEVVYLPPPDLKVFAVNQGRRQVRQPDFPGTAVLLSALLD